MRPRASSPSTSSRWCGRRRTLTAKASPKGAHRRRPAPQAAVFVLHRDAARCGRSPAPISRSKPSPPLRFAISRNALPNCPSARRWKHSARGQAEMHSPAAARKSSTPGCAIRSAAVRRARRSGSRCIASGTRWSGTQHMHHALRSCWRRWHTGIDHLRRLRELQDETHGFTALVPFAVRAGAQPALAPSSPRASAFEDLRNLALSRGSISTTSITSRRTGSALGLPLAQVALSYGVERSVAGLSSAERISSTWPAAKTPQGQTIERLERAIREAGRVPVQRDTLVSSTLNLEAARTRRRWFAGRRNARSPTRTCAAFHRTVPPSGWRTRWICLRI